MIIIIDPEYRVYKTHKVTPQMIDKVMKGNLSILNTDDMTGINIDCTWSDIQDWQDHFIKETL